MSRLTRKKLYIQDALFTINHLGERHTLMCQPPNVLARAYLKSRQPPMSNTKALAPESNTRNGPSPPRFHRMHCISFRPS